MPVVLRAAKESPYVQGVDEQIPYEITTTPWGSSPTGVSVVAKEVTNALFDVTATVFPVNSPTVSGDVITLSVLRSLTAEKVYRIEVKFTTGTTVWETYAEVRAEI